MTIDTFPPESRIWIFAFTQQLAEQHEQTIRRELEAFVVSWTAHKAAVHANFDIRYHQFVIVAADEAAVKVSGCSTDSLFREIKRIGSQLGLSLADISSVIYRDGEAVRVLAREDFKQEVQAGRVTKETVAFNTTITNVGEFVRGRWEVPVRESWHAKAFFGA